MSVTQVKSELAKGQVRPAYLLAGSEPLLRDDALAAIESAVLAEGPRDFNLDRLEVGPVPPGIGVIAPAISCTVSPRILV